MSSEGNKDIAPEAVSMEQSSISGAKRKRGRPRKYEYPTYELPQRAQPIQSIPPLQSTQGGSNIRQDGIQANHTSGDIIGPKMCTFQVLPAQKTQGNRSVRPKNSANLVKTSDNQSYSSKDDILGKRFIGKMTNKFPGFCLITVKVKDNQMLKGWIPDQNNLNPITPKYDLAPELPMLRPSQVQKQASAIPMQAAPPVPIHLEDVTLAKPLQMRRPVDKTIAKHAMPLAARPYMGSGVVAAVPVSLSPSNVETGTLAKKDTQCMISQTSQSSVAAVPITSVQPVSVSGKKMANQNELLVEKSFNDFEKDSESSNGAKDSSVKVERPNAALVNEVVKDSTGERQPLNVQVTDGVGESSGQNQHFNTTVNDEIKIASGSKDQPNSTNSDHHSSKEPSDIAEKSDQPKIENVVLKGVDDSKSDASDDCHSGSARDEKEMKVDSD
ncbi:hypothetical protein EJB05_20910 [Eragrostis curvula]|uniref:Uncharacterized protein n=1 Tax=Eragrostis curvula TaxID=38414 RepID=A0A5J9V1U9_9POAL|nr:hypothetical protein EJB05_20910 [Eragrostis curvula]